MSSAQWWINHRGRWETLFTKHNKTVLPLLTITKKVIHSSFINTAVDNMADNRVLNNQPPPIIHEETIYWDGNRPLFRPLYTIELLQKSVTAAYPTDMKHVNLWNRPVESRRYENWALYARKPGKTEENNKKGIHQQRNTHYISHVQLHTHSCRSSVRRISD